MSPKSPVYLHELQIGDRFRTSKWADGGALLSNCQYQRCRCVFEVVSAVMTRVHPRAPKYRHVKVVRRCDTKTRRHEDQNRIARYRHEGRELPKGTIMAYAWVLKVDPLAEALTTELAA